MEKWLKEINDKKAFLHNKSDHSNQNEMAPDRWWLEKNDEWCVWISFPLDANMDEFYFVKFTSSLSSLFVFFVGLKVFPSFYACVCVYVWKWKKFFFLFFVDALKVVSLAPLSQSDDAVLFQFKSVKSRRRPLSFDRTCIPTTPQKLPIARVLLPCWSCNV